jgi:hypothetical protein
MKHEPHDRDGWAEKEYQSEAERKHQLLRINGW